MRFVGGRVSLIPIKNNIFYSEGSEKRFSYIVTLLSERREFKARKDINLILDPILDSTGKLVGGKIGREAITKLPIKRGGTLSRVPTQICPYIWFLIYPSEQIILFERKQDVFSKELVLFDYLTRYFNRELYAKGLEVTIRPLSVKGEFWKLLGNVEKLFSVRFYLKAPNLLGETYDDLRDILNKEKNDNNATEVEVGISNTAGELMIRDQNKYSRMVGWVEDGGGDWKVTAKAKGQKGRPHIFRNSDQLTIFDLDIDQGLVDMEGNDALAFIKEVSSRLNIDSHRIKKD